MEHNLKSDVDFQTLVMLAEKIVSIESAYAKDKKGFHYIKKDKQTILNETPSFLINLIKEYPKFSTKEIASIIKVQLQSSANKVHNLERSTLSSIGTLETMINRAIGMCDDIIKTIDKKNVATMTDKVEAKSTKRPKSP